MRFIPLAACRFSDGSCAYSKYCSSARRDRDLVIEAQLRGRPKLHQIFHRRTEDRDMGRMRFRPALERRRGSSTSSCRRTSRPAARRGRRPSCSGWRSSRMDSPSSRRKSMPSRSTGSTSSRYILPLGSRRCQTQSWPERIRQRFSCGTTRTCTDAAYRPSGGTGRLSSRIGLDSAGCDRACRPNRHARAPSSLRPSATTAMPSMRPADENKVS